MKKLIHRLLQRFGIQLVRIHNKPRTSVNGFFSYISKQWQPDAVIDVGAAIGSFTQTAKQFFPNSQYILFEPLDEFASALDAYGKNHPKIKIFHTAVGDKKGSVELNVHQDLVGSSLFKEVEGELVDGIKRTVAMDTLDNVLKNYSLENVLLKIDVQGAEKEVLEGASNVLAASVECLILEVSLFKSVISAPAPEELLLYLKEKGFVLYDIVGLLYRPYDGALSQMDLVFVKEKGRFRTYAGFATSEQRKHLLAYKKA